MSEKSVRKMPLGSILKSSYSYCLQNKKQMLLFMLIAYILGCMAIISWKKITFLPVVVLMYVLWGTFFRVYARRKPYFDWNALFNSLIPSTKIVVLTVIIGLLLVFLPFIPVFISSSAEFNEKYLRFLQGNFEGHDTLSAITNVLFILVSPLIAYRPFLAWISALNGRSGSLSFAWQKTKGNYAAFLLIAILTNISITFARWLILTLGGNDYITLLVVASVVIYFNVIAAKAYEFFFLDK